jgi:hypothetical protein
LPVVIASARVAQPQPTVILLEADGSAVVLRTPHGRSARFRSRDEALRWLDGNHAVVLPVLGAGVVAAFAKAILHTETFGPVLVVVLGMGMFGSLGVWLRVRNRLPSPRWLSWEESVRLDTRDHPLSAAWKDVGIALLAATLLAGAVFLIWADPYRIRRSTALELLLVGSFLLGLLTGVGLGIWSAVQRVRFHRVRSTLG